MRGETLSSQAGVYGMFVVFGSEDTWTEKPKNPKPNSVRHVDPVILNCLHFHPSPLCRPVTVLQPILENLAHAKLDPEHPEIHTLDWDGESAPLYSRFGSIDGAPFQQNELPYKALIMKDFNPETDMHPKTNILKLPLNKTIVLVIRSATAFSHPIHLHGHKYEVLEIIPRQNETCESGRCPWANLKTSFSQPIEELALRPRQGECSFCQLSARKS